MEGQIKAHHEQVKREKEEKERKLIEEQKR